MAEDELKEAQPTAQAEMNDAAKPASMDALVETLQARIEALEQQVAQAKDQALRAVAEAQNVRHRADKDVDNARKYALENFAGDLVPVVDNLERALAQMKPDNDAVKALAEGVALTQRSFLDVLAKFNVQQLSPIGEPFDPKFHEAIAMVENLNAEPNTVLDVMQKGYTLNGRLVRAAMVVVAKAPTAKVDTTA